MLYSKMYHLKPLLTREGYTSDKPGDLPYFNYNDRTFGIKVREYERNIPINSIINVFGITVCAA